MENAKRLIQAKLNKKDEFYTKYETISREIESYPIETWQDKIIYCPCDKDGSSQFLEYFEDHFYELGLKELHGTYLAEDGEKSWHYVFNRKELSYEIQLNGNGDFRSDECIEILKKADIVITNPPFSLFRDFVSLLIEHKKQFLIIGQINSIACNNIFSYIRDKKMWLGTNTNISNIEFRVPDSYELTGTACRIDENGLKYICIKGIRWWTNLNRFYKKPPLKLTKRYNSIDYPKYDNYDAINVDKVSDIPIDYKGVIGVPITFLDKYNPEQFEILGISHPNDYFTGISRTKRYVGYQKFNKDGVLLSKNGADCNNRCCLKGKKKGKNYYQLGDDIIHVLYARLFIRYR